MAKESVPSLAGLDLSPLAYPALTRRAFLCRRSAAAFRLFHAAALRLLLGAFFIAALRLLSDFLCVAALRLVFAAGCSEHRGYS